MPALTFSVYNVRPVPRHLRRDRTCSRASPLHVDAGVGERRLRRHDLRRAPAQEVGKRRRVRGIGDDASPLPWASTSTAVSRSMAIARGIGRPAIGEQTCHEGQRPAHPVAFNQMLVGDETGHPRTARRKSRSSVMSRLNGSARAAAEVTDLRCAEYEELPEDRGPRAGAPNRHARARPAREWRLQPACPSSCSRSPTGRRRR